MNTDRSLSEPRETYAPEVPADTKLERYRESWEMLEESTHLMLRPRYTLAGCLPPGNDADTRLERYQESLGMLEEALEDDERQQLESMGLFVQGLLLKELARLEQYRARLTVG